MVRATYKTVFAAMAALAMSSADAASVCYAPWFHQNVTKEVLQADVQLMGEYFLSFRTFETLMSGVNIIEVAASVNVKVAVGVQMNDLTKVDEEIKAVCDGYAKYSSAVEAIWVGNENLKNGDFGTVNAEELVVYIKKVKECTGGAVPVGTAQRITEWLDAPGADQVAATCDQLGTNIYPFFTQGEESAIRKLEIQWDQMAKKYNATKIVVAETGWPSDGGDSHGNKASIEIMQQYFYDFIKWSSTKGTAYWFMMFDTNSTYVSEEKNYEKYFGCFDVNGKPKLTIPKITSQGDQSNDSADVPEQQGGATPTPEQPHQGTPEQPADVPEQQGGATPTPEQPHLGLEPPQQPGVATHDSTKPHYNLDVPEYRTHAPNPAGDTPAARTPAHATPASSGKDCAM